MNNTLKKSIVIISILLFLIPAISSTYAMSTNENAKILGESQQKTITIYRVAPDESITPIEIEVGEETNDIGKYLESKCSELFEKDLEMQSLIQKLQSNETKDKNLLDNKSLIRVKSHGRGFHIKTKINFCILSILKLNNQFILPRILLEIFLPSLRKSLIVGFYNDEKANTTFYPIIQSKSTPNSVTYLEGKHTIIIASFYGYTTWTGRFSCLISEILFKKELLPHAFSGVGLLVSYKS
ncbi:MAG: hypothetical protein A3K77_02705 [Euryarchaeota archaeon RBG_13_31_8]|nr:MAG: hypothetical protein A3K77_02705 [Euryarchaeota archaeon RBG_13_31_8]